jgi:EAL domain-containing protein (putative c-di-GMP-specific phosphodiesterase class I)
MKTMAEFVENEDTVNKLINLGIDYAQGYYFSKPQCIEDLYRAKSPRSQTG